MNHVSIISFLLLMTQTLAAQLTGTLVDEGGKAISSANVLLLKSADTTVIKGTLSDAGGNFAVVNVAPGSYRLQVTAVGYKSWSSDVFELKAPVQQKDVGTVVLSPALNELESVVIRAEKPLYQQRPDGTILNVEKSVLNKGSSALEVLERSPGVVVNRRDNTIALNGKNGVMVLLNGKLLRMSEAQLFDLLNGLQADNIATIELLTTPPAKYDAEGSAGLINIVLKKNTAKGTSGDISASAGYGYRPKSTAGFTVARNQAKVNAYSSYNFSHNRSYSRIAIDSWQNMPFVGGELYVNAKDTSHFFHNNHNATAGIDINLNKQVSFGGSLIFNSRKSAGFTNSHLGYNVLPDSLLQYDGKNSGKIVWNNIIGSLYAAHSFNEKSKFNIGLDYLYYHQNGPYEVHGTFVNKHGQNAGNNQPLSAPAQKGFANTEINVAVAKTDYTRTINKSLVLETGLKGSVAKSSSSAGFESLVNGDWLADPQAISSIAMKEWIGAAYVSLAAKLAAAANLTAGFRYEYAATQMHERKTGRQVVKRGLGALFPSLLYDKKIGDYSGIQISYSRRITRPSYNDLASYVGYSDPTAVYTGNPFLKPTISNTIRIGYNFKRYAFALLFSRDKNTIARYQITESPDHDMLYISPQNISWQNNLTAQVTLPLKIAAWWNMQTGFVGGLRRFLVDYSKEPFEYSYFGYTVNNSQVFTLPHDFSIELAGSYNNTTYNGTQQVAGILRLNLGIKKILAGNQGTFQLSVTDLLRNELYDIHYGAIAKEAFDIRNHVIVYTESAKVPVFRLSYSRSFGNNKTKTAKANGSADEQERVRKE